MTRSKRIIALAVAAAIVFAMAFSVLFIVREEEHECSGVDCQFCQQMNAAMESFLHHTPKPQNTALLSIVSFALMLVLGMVRQGKVSDTLTALKVKLSD